MRIWYNNEKRLLISLVNEVVALLHKPDWNKIGLVSAFSSLPYQQCEYILSWVAEQLLLQLPGDSKFYHNYYSDACLFFLIEVLMIKLNEEVCSLHSDATSAEQELRELNQRIRNKALHLWRICSCCKKPTCDNKCIIFCGSCRVVGYCSSKCKRKHEPVHFGSCKSFAKYQEEEQGRRNEWLEQNLLVANFKKPITWRCMVARVILECFDDFVEHEDCDIMTWMHYVHRWRDTIITSNHNEKVVLFVDYHQQQLVNALRVPFLIKLHRQLYSKQTNDTFTLFNLHFARHFSPALQQSAQENLNRLQALMLNLCLIIYNTKYDAIESHRSLYA